MRDYGGAEVVAEGYRNAQLKAYQSIAKPAPASEERTGTGEFLVTKVSLPDEDGRPTASVACGRCCCIQMDCERRLHIREITTTLAQVVIYDEVGSRMFALSSMYSPEQLPRLNDKAAILCELPKLPLLPGTYRLNYSLHINEECADARTSAVTFQVIPPLGQILPFVWIVPGASSESPVEHLREARSIATSSTHYWR